MMESTYNIKIMMSLSLTQLTNFFLTDFISIAYTTRTQYVPLQRVLWQHHNLVCPHKFVEHQGSVQYDSHQTAVDP